MFPQPGRTSTEDVVCARFGEEEEKEDEGEAGSPDQDPDGPGPAFELCGPVADYRADGWTGNIRNTIDSEGVRSLGGAVHVCQRGTSCGENGTTEEAGEETESEKLQKLAQHCAD